MKRVTLISVCAVIVGLVLAAIGFSMGGKQTLALTDEGVKIINTADKSSIDKTFDGFQNIEINSLNIESLVLKEGKTFAVKGEQVEAYGNMKAEVRDGTLKITGDRQYYKLSLFGLSISSEETRGALEITYPAGTKLGTVRITSGTAHVEVRDLTADTVDIASNVGNMRLEKVRSRSLRLLADTGNSVVVDTEANAATFRGDVGNWEIEGFKSKELTMRSRLGNIDISKSVLEGRSVIEQNTGNVTVALLQNENEMSYEINGGMGNVSVNGTSADGGTLKNTVAGSGNSLKMLSDLGDVSLRFAP
ncbi:MAG: DUF4097 domain-containing protein [Clostridiales Family XIII bacterium]|nr:DUF4097 domain-containing protein [Clostridiales Family XIII bacterium]